MPKEVSDEEYAAFEASKVENAKLKADLDALKAKPKDEPKDESKGDDGLLDKARKDREGTDRRAAETKALENAIKFNFSVSDFVTTNSDLLPTELPDILKAAEKEKYDSATEKANAVKAAFLGSFFAVQANVDFLTSSQKAMLQDYNGLTVAGRRERAGMLYDNVLEPAIEMLRKVKKAEEVGKAKAGFASTGKVDEDYKRRLISGSKKFYLGERGDN